MAEQDIIEETETNVVFVTISETASISVKNVIKEQNRTDLFLRLFVQSAYGALSFGMALDSRKSDDDQICLVDDIEVRIDRISFPYLEGANVDYVQSDEKSGFQITSPNAHLLAQGAAAGCGSCSGGAGCC
ncbi:MAG: iron-sulfur cluster assembly accessory protein [Candidatus Heimdallarchaeota archaeon]|nr:iron-sulfur cluster assembly accessory protein [Candidatus Heimdallarchaeota archaeon]MDH5645054.1 iron-sulfur cluster assembly accessory protein [Candidatus Heimdallarchaeota archaeon]